jgi:hypothetical protein
MLGIGGGTFVPLALKLLVLFLVFTYLALIYWTRADAKRRIDDSFLIACATAASVLFPFVGTVVYTILRPPEFIEDREERELELRAAEIQLRQLIEQSCPHCEYPITASYLRCPNCERRLRSPCRKCAEPLDPKWGVCPYCETEVRKRRRDREVEPGRPARAPRAGRAGAGERSPPGERPSSADRSRAAAGSGSSPGSDEQPAGARADGKGKRADRPSRRESRPPTRTPGGRSQDRPTGGASGSFPGTDRER